MASNSAIIELIDGDPNGVQVVSVRPKKPIEVVDPTPRWAASFVLIAQRIRTALGDRALAIEHSGSTSIPIAAKDVIDVDLVVADPADEASYAKALEDAGFQFLLREPGWYEHRLFGLGDPYANIHVFGPNSAELARHRIFKKWIAENESDRLVYVKAKRAAAEAGRETGDTVTQYNKRKDPVVKEILKRAFAAQGLL
ncbi:hypothetical protein JX265_007389 [Neoarthrinium moseri]|uniref:GrpB domain protein n=1 Tax=Neoarthrinium moseri TaxID=1658444 RepID=A0A9P9WKL8_9PEZI|nr:uncharacterized protein JN550_009112 [Neoarthrinium moseri]KAI1843603.1 hypothetical protein JX266_010236 [Neoarthrinium moseri]KAI1864092.1 hypothetical protein JN550_009112 [Neoarthrinium moseri]KAI1867587.1 hypothetical protein JX265_007389 [Neoarthrinium moseri]